MECREAREIVSEAFDRGVSAVERAAEAREHCRSCAECRAFVEGLSLLRKTPAPKAPTRLVEDIVERAQKMAAADTPRPSRPFVVASDLEGPARAPDSDAESETVPVVALPPAPERRDARGTWWWLPRAVAVTGAAAAVVAALAMSFQGFRALRPPAQDRTAVTAGAPAATGESGTGASPAGVPSAKQGADASRSSSVHGGYADEAGGPRYISLNERAYAYLGIRAPEPATIEALTQQASSAFDTTMPAASYPVWQSKTDPEIVFIRSEETSSTYSAFRRVSRSRAGKSYLLYAAPELDRFGLWPALPSRFDTPTAADGAPTFITAGKDDSGLDIYVPPGHTADEGFAIAPGTGSSDAAAADPYWTWWMPR